MKNNWKSIIWVVILLVFFGMFSARQVVSAQEVQETDVALEPESEPIAAVDTDGWDWKITKVFSATKFEVTYIGFGCVQIVITECVSGQTIASPEVNDLARLVGSQKWETKDWKTGERKQDIRWRETSYLECGLFLGKLWKCPPICPECIEP